MRRKYITSPIKLPITLSLLIMASISVAKKEVKETEIICFATKDKWICAPEDKQNIANEKAAKLLEKQTSELEPTDIVIKSINIPKFNTYDSSQSRNNPVGSLDPARNDLNLEKSQQQVNNKPDIKSPNEAKIAKTENDNPYAKLWSHQLIGVSTHQSAINYVHKNQINQEDVLIIKSTRLEKDWWIVLFGLYKDKQTGLDNENNLPRNINKPWLRPLKNLVVNGFIEQY